MKSGITLVPTITDLDKNFVHKADSDNSPRMEARGVNNIKEIQKKKRVGTFSCRVCGSLFLQ